MEETKKTTKLMIGSVMLSNVHPHVSAGLAAMLGWLGRHRPDVEPVLATPGRVEISSARNLCIGAALEQNMDFFFWLDDDTECAISTLQVLLERLENIPDIHMISPMYYVRGYPFKLMAFVEDGHPLRWKLIEEPYEIDANGLIRCVAIGNGCTMVRMSVFRQILAMGDSSEWYRTGKYHTEDAYFCSKARNLIPGFTCAIDTSITAKHMVGTSWVSKDNVRWLRLKHKIVEEIVRDPSFLYDLETFVSDNAVLYDGKEASQEALEYDSSLGRL